MQTLPCLGQGSAEQDPEEAHLRPIIVTFHRQTPFLKRKSLSQGQLEEKKMIHYVILDPRRGSLCAFSKREEVLGHRWLRYKESGVCGGVYTLVAPPPSQCFPNGDLWQCLEMFRVVTRGWGGGCYWYLAGRGQGCCSTSSSAQGIIPQKRITQPQSQQHLAPRQPSSHVLEHLQRALPEYRGSPTDLFTPVPQKTPFPSLI